MRKLIAFIAIMLIASTLCMAQTARNPVYNQEGKTNFTRIGCTGLDVTGNPGFLELYGTGASGVTGDTNGVYYLWVDNNGTLRIASWAHLNSASTTSFPNGNWQGLIGTVVGSQS